MKLTGVLSQSKYTHFCGACTCCLTEPAQPCPECASAPPPQGWPTLDSGPYRYLGQTIDDRYLLDQFLGDGATGYVYRARAVQINRKFACKIVDTRRYKKKEFEEELLRRFSLEVEAMSRLRNPHVVAIYEAMQLGEGVFALMMDYVDGRTLQDLLDRVGRVKLDRGLDLIRQIANGLYEAHRAGFIHRDLKPDNIMVERLPASGFFARILDFGIVHVMGNADATQGFRGTPLFASPEQCMGDPGIDSRSDIYSLACVFFHCLTGQPPFPGTESLRVMDAHVNEPPPRLADILPDSSFPAKLEDLIAQMLAKEPGDRPQDLGVVIRQIDEITRSLDVGKRQRKSTNPGRQSSSIPAISRENSERELRAAPESTDAVQRTTGGHRAVGSDTAGRSQVVSPLLEYRLPDSVATEATAFTACALNGAGDMATVADQTNRVHVLSLKDDGIYHTLRGARGLIVSVHFDPMQRAVFASEMDGTVLRWSLDAPEEPKRLGKLDERIYVLATVPDGKRVLCGTEKGRVVAITVENGKTDVLVDGGSPISALGFSPTENRLIVGYWGGKLDTIHLATNARTALEPVPRNAKSIVVSRDGYLAAVLDEGGHVRILSMIDGRPYYTMQASMASLRALAFADDGQLMGLGVMKTSMQLWEIRNRPVARQSASISAS